MSFFCVSKKNCSNISWRPRTSPSFRPFSNRQRFMFLTNNQSFSLSLTSIPLLQTWRRCSSVRYASTTPFPRSFSVSLDTSFARLVAQSCNAAPRAEDLSATFEISLWRKSHPPSCFLANTPPADARYGIGTWEAERGKGAVMQLNVVRLCHLLLMIWGHPKKVVQRAF